MGSKGHCRVYKYHWTMWIHLRNVISSILPISYQSLQWNQILTWIQIEMISKTVNSCLSFSSKRLSTVNINILIMLKFLYICTDRKFFILFHIEIKTFFDTKMDEIREMHEVGVSAINFWSIYVGFTYCS